MPRLLLIFVAAFTWLLPAPMSANQTRIPVELEWLMGKWEGGGTHSGRESKASLEAGYALGSTVVELRYVMTLQVKFFPKFEGRAFYRPLPEGGWKAHWFDSFGNELPVTATLEGTTLTADWGTAGTEQGRTIYRLLGDGRLEIVDFVLQPDGTRREFARQTFVRARP